MKNNEPSGFLGTLKPFLVQLQHDQKLLLFCLFSAFAAACMLGWLLKAIFLPLLFELKFLKKRKVHKIFWN